MNTAVAGPNPGRSVILLLLVGAPASSRRSTPSLTLGPRSAGRSARSRRGFPGPASRSTSLSWRPGWTAWPWCASSITDDSPIHEAGYQLLQTGRLCRAGEESPHFGSVVARIVGTGRGLPTSVLLPGPIASTGVDIPRGQSAGCLVPASTRSSGLAETRPMDSIASGRVTERRRSGGVACWRAGWSRPGPRGDGQHVRDGLRPGLLGLSRLLAVQHVRRLRPAPVPTFDRAFAGLLDHLERSGRLESTLVVASGEFGRSPRINASGGRDHSPGVWTVAIAGGGVAVARSSARATTTRPRLPTGPSPCPTCWRRSISAWECDDRAHVMTADGRPMPLVEDGSPIHELFA